MASFDEKVEALRNLRERRQAREAEKAVAAPQTSSEDCLPRKDLAAELDGHEMTKVLEHYARAQEPAQSPEAPEAPPGGDKDEADALYCLGHCFEQGLHDCSLDKGKAAAHYRMAADQGSAVAQWRLGHLHEYGEGVERCDVMAAHFYRLAAEAGQPQAQSSLAILLEDGRAGVCDDAEALHWHLAAAAQGQALSQYCASRCLAEGRGAEQDEATAQTLLEKSAAGGFPLAVEALSQSSAGKDREDGDFEEGLMDMAARVAKQMGHLSDADADAFLEELMGSLDDTGGSVLSAMDLQEALAMGKLPPNTDGELQERGGYPVWSGACAAMA